MVPELDHRATVPALFAQAVKRFGPQDFVISTTDRMSFVDAEQRSARLAQRLIDGGAGKGTRIGIVLPSGVDFTVAFLAVARIGAVAMLFSSTYRPAELARVVRITDVDTLIAPSVLLGREYAPILESAFEGLASHGPGPLRLASVPYLRSIWLVGDQRDTAPSWATPIDRFDSSRAVDRDLLIAIEEQVTPSDLLLSICTSGSSADPKVVLHTHGNSVRKVHPSTGLGLPNSNPGERVLLVMPFFWVGGPQSLLGAMYSGSPLLSQERFDLEGAIDLIERERVTMVAGWSTVTESVRKHAAETGRDVSSLKALPPYNFRSSKGDPVNLGMTETFGPHHSPDFFDYQIVDPETRLPLPEGEVGEFCVRGRGAMFGIYKRERDETFDADGWYHTGDRGYLEAGRVWFLGRYSEMLKSGGANVAPAEVELVLVGFPGVSEAYVVGVPHPTAGQEVVAVVVPAVGATLDENDLRMRAKEVLSGYKVPARFVIVDAAEVPRLATGKPDKRTLAATLAESD